MKRIRYRGIGTGLRLEDPRNQARTIDISGSHVKGAPLECFVADGKGGAALIDLDPAEVVLVMEACAQYLARHFRVPEARA